MDDDRLFDIAANDFTCAGMAPTDAEYQFSADVRKFRHFASACTDIAFKYRAVAIWDDDIEASTQTINQLFIQGLVRDFMAWQGAFTATSCVSWPHLKVREGIVARPTNMLELACPFFSNAGLVKCLPTFDESESSWGIEWLWTRAIEDWQMAVFDAYPVGHYRPISAHGARVLPSGYTAPQEAKLLFAKYCITKRNPF
jgi:hypothetical protein